MDSIFYVTSLLFLAPTVSAIVAFLIGSFPLGKQFVIAGILLLCLQVAILFFYVPPIMADRIQRIPDCKKKKEILSDKKIRIYEYLDLLYFSEDCLLWTEEEE